MIPLTFNEVIVPVFKKGFVNKFMTEEPEELEVVEPDEDEDVDIDVDEDEF